MDQFIHGFAKLLQSMFLVGMAGSALVIVLTIVEAVRVMLGVPATRVD